MKSTKVPNSCILFFFFNAKNKIVYLKNTVESNLRKLIELDVEYRMVDQRKEDERRCGSEVWKK